MARHKDQQWSMPEGQRQPDGSRVHQWDAINASLLMDLRDELKELNRTLSCWRVRDAMDAIRRIDRRMAKHYPLTSRKKR